ncbi:uncharacterized protein LOC124119944 [Haliotis rufescens]|uniref:uncharacterized protein LOC124119944 n=1 Tax=Haliotis rufescens TaxID=6454 RepID=UPI00201EF533|nr:uncharacterized protein LOC124119944 [Haliotis rufescens]
MLSLSATKVLFIMVVAVLFLLVSVYDSWSDSISLQYVGSDVHSQPITHKHTPRHDKWIVTTSIASDVANVSGWKIIVLQHTKETMEHCRFPWCSGRGTDHFNTPQAGSETWTRRRLQAYTYAISHDAKVIGVVRHLDSHMLHVLRRMAAHQSQTGIVLKTNQTFVDPSVSKKDMMSAATAEREFTMFDYYIETRVRPLILSGPFGCVKNGICPDKRTYFHSSSQHPPVFLPRNTFTSLSSEMTVFRYDAFWALPLLDVDIGDLIVQRFVWELDGMVGIHPVPVSSLRNQRRFVMRRMWIADLLRSWKCTVNSDLLYCLGNVINRIGSERLVPLKNVVWLTEWISELRKNSYDIPARQFRQRTLNRATTIGLLKTPLANSLFNKFAYRYLKELCPGADIRFPLKIIDDIALIITFNVPRFYKNIQSLEAMYRPYFPNIIYCGPKLKAFKKFVSNFTTGHFLYVEAFKRGWYYMYECTVEAMKLNLDVKGFLQIGDDTLINPWNLYSQPRDKIWLLNSFRRANASLDELKPRWGWWSKVKPRIQAVLNEIRNIAEHGSERGLEYRFLQNFQNISRNFTNLFIQTCDFMYTPATFKDNFTSMANLLLKHKVMIEIGFANIALGLQRWQNIHFVTDGGLWGNRDKYISMYNPKRVFLHPFKVQTYLKTVPGRHFFCNTYLNRTLRPP